MAACSYYPSALRRRVLYENAARLLEVIGKPLWSGRRSARCGVPDVSVLRGGAAWDTGRMRSASLLRPVLLASWMILPAVPALAVPTAFPGTLRVSFGLPGLAPMIDVTDAGTGSAEVTHSGGVIDAVTGVAAERFGLFQTVPNPPSGLLPIDEITLLAYNSAGKFSGLASGSGGGQMGIEGLVVVDIGTQTFPFDLTFLGLDGVGLEGPPVPPQGPLSVVVIGAPWSVGTVSNGIDALSGFASANAIRLVTPIRATSPFVPEGIHGFGVLDLVFVPEPGTAALVGLGLALLGARRSRRVVPALE